MVMVVVVMIVVVMVMIMVVVIIMMVMVVVRIVVVMVMIMVVVILMIVMIVVVMVVTMMYMLCFHPFSYSSEHQETTGSTNCSTERPSSRAYWRCSSILTEGCGCIRLGRAARTRRAYLRSY
jgi:amino acid transporter